MGKVADLDLYLKLCLRHLKKYWFNSKTGFVACLIADGDKIAITTNTFKKNGRLIHAENNTLKLFEKKFGKVGPKALAVVTLSPCVIYSKNRIGPSCVSLLRERGIEQLYIGHLHAKQGELETYRQLGFSPAITSNQQISKACERLLDIYLANKEETMKDIDKWLDAKSKINPSFLEI